MDNKVSSRIFSSKDKKYLFNFTLADILGTLNFEEMVKNLQNV